jgi:hypothetical protein
MSINKKYISILSIAIAILLSACSSDNPEVQTVSADAKPVGEDIQVMAYAPPFASADPTDPSNPTGFYAYTPDKTTNMGIYMLLSDNPSEDWASPEEKKLTYTNKWHAYFDVTPDKNYTVYGYMPKTGKMESSLTKSAADAATLTIRNIKPITTEDICIITGVKDAREGLKEGQFSWSWPIPASEEENYKIHILMDHLYAAALFSMKIDAEYAQLRTIKLKTMTLSTEYGSVNATITLTHNDTGASPISDDVTYSASDGNSTAEIFNSEEGVALKTTESLDISACFAPTLSGSLTMVTTYDVYDRKGYLIRKNCTATNKLPNMDAVRAQQVQLNLTVNPTYLNVLSDYDLDNPTVK